MVNDWRSGFLYLLVSNEEFTLVKTSKRSIDVQDLQNRVEQAGAGPLRVVLGEDLIVDRQFYCITANMGSTRAGLLLSLCKE